MIKLKREKLGGLTIKGKIELPKEPEKKKRLVASTDTIDLKNKKKRKRKETPTGKLGGKVNKREKTEISEKEIQDKIRRTLSKIEGNKNKSLKSKFRKKRRDDHESIRLEQEERDEQEKNVLQVTEFLSATN